ncbi:DUF4326 domain-containing protein [Actinoplanes sp. NPDC023936]|uniref:DUF4326 domain-containing protein n=1 Tax=Actinoplanes sp. NPDC023936 TaxID=3154910 RepID=UPI0033D7750D
MPKRIQRRRTAGWRMPETAVYVGRPTIYGNPFRAGVDFCGPTIECLYTPAGLVAKFRTWLAATELHPLFWDSNLITAHIALKAALKRGDLTGRDLACWCPPGQPCHADVLLEVANPKADFALVGNCIGCRHDLRAGPCGGCGAVAGDPLVATGSKPSDGAP